MVLHQRYLFNNNREKGFSLDFHGALIPLSEPVHDPQEKTTVKKGFDSVHGFEDCATGLCPPASFFICGSPGRVLCQRSGLLPCHTDDNPVPAFDEDPKDDHEQANPGREHTPGDPDNPQPRRKRWFRSIGNFPHYPFVCRLLDRSGSASRESGGERTASQSNYPAGKIPFPGAGNIR
jgi:hypothetical protein